MQNLAPSLGVKRRTSIVVDRQSKGGHGEKKPWRSAGGWGILSARTRIINPSQDAHHPPALRQGYFPFAIYHSGLRSACKSPGNRGRATQSDIGD